MMAAADVAVVASVSRTTEEDVEARAERPSSADSISQWSDYGFRWLFNPYRFDHLPIEEQVLQYKHRDLLRSKVYKFGCRVFGQTQARTRTITAPPMEQELHGRQISVKRSAESPPTAEGETRSGVEEARTTGYKYTQKEEEYRAWLTDRKQFRKDLENMGLDIDWLSRKPHKTPVEQRVLQRILEEKYPKEAPPSPLEDIVLQPVLPVESPVICRPSPLAVQIIEKYLLEKKLRLVDLFKAVDKDKNWLITREEFRKAIKQADIPLPDDLLEDLVITLDQDLDDQLDYRELAKGIGLWKVEKRESKRKNHEWSPDASSGRASVISMASSKGQRAYSSLSDKPAALPEEGGDSAKKTPVHDQRCLQQGGNGSQLQRTHSSLSALSTTSSHTLEPPEPDVRPECRYDSPEAFVDLRKRNRETLARLTGKTGKPVKTKKGTTHDTKSMITTGEAAVDGHMQPSTLGGETAEQVDRFRQLRLQEYHQVCALCKESGVPLSQTLLEKVLLFPPDKTHAAIKRSIKRAGGSLWSTKITTKQKGAVKGRAVLAPAAASAQSGNRSRPTRVVTDPRGSYPTKKSVAASPVKVHLSTGRALVSRQVDCWLSYEEYEQLTRHLGSKYTQLHGHSDDNAFWPGHLLDKIRLCMPNAEPKLNSVFSRVKPQKKSNLGYNNDLLTWPISADGYVQHGSVDPYQNNFIHN